MLVSIARVTFDMGNQERRAAYGSLWVLALSFGWIEASVVVYLREIYRLGSSRLETTYFAGLQLFQVPLVSLPGPIVAVEIAREACTIVLLAAVAWLAGRRTAARAGAFLLSFGVWDLTYYAGLKLALGWPDSLSAWDILFLIPLPWVAPVWAPVTVSAVFVVAGSYLFWTSDRDRRYRWPDIAVLIGSVGLTIAAFLVESGAAADQRVPERFPVWLFWTGVLLGTLWFVRVERGGAWTGTTRKSWVGGHARSIVPTDATTAARSRWPRRPIEAGQQTDLHRVVSDYAEARRRLEALADETAALGARFERLAHGLSAHPTRTIVGVPDRFIENPAEWDVVPSDPLPPIEGLAALTDDMRAAALMVENLRERLILMGHSELVEQPDPFFH